MRIDETHECRIFGVVQTIIHEHPLGDPATCIRAVKRAKQSAPTQVSERAIAYALSQIREHIQYKRHWFAVFAVLRDLRVVGASASLSTFCPRLWARRLPISTSRTWRNSTC